MDEILEKKHSLKPSAARDQSGQNQEEMEAVSCTGVGPFFDNHVALIAFSVRLRPAISPSEVVDIEQLEGGNTVLWTLHALHPIDSNLNPPAKDSDVFDVVLVPVGAGSPL